MPSHNTPKSAGDVTVKFLPVIHNATSWKYPLDLHIDICNRLRVNPTVWIIPTEFRNLIAEHFPKAREFAQIDAFADETGNVVYFWNSDWTPDYERWVICHELYHVGQYFDKGNMYGTRWEGLDADEMLKAWEREATRFANDWIGKRVHKDFPAYRSQIKKKAAKKASGQKRKKAASPAQ